MLYNPQKTAFYRGDKNSLIFVLIIYLFEQIFRLKDEKMIYELR